MKEESTEDIQSQIEDALLERPVMFRASGQTFYIYPMTIGKMHILRRIMERLALDERMMTVNFSYELLRVVGSEKELCCELLAYMTARNDYYSVFDMTTFEQRKAVFMDIDESALATLLTVILTADRTEAYIKHLGIDEEQRYMSKVMKVKEESDKNSYTFGGVSIFGSMIDAVMERYKMTKRQVVWELDYTSMRLLLADKVTTVMVTDEERRKVNIPKDRTKINGDSREDLMMAIRSQSWD